MEIVALIIGLVVLILAAAALRVSGVRSQIERQEGQDAGEALETTRRINDATDDPLPADPARDWLRGFGGGSTARKR